VIEESFEISGTQVFVIDSLTFTGNRVRSALLGLLKTCSQSNVTCLNMISSRLALEILAHSFNFVNFCTLSNLPELDSIWDLPEEGRWIRSLLTSPESDI